MWLSYIYSYFYSSLSLPLFLFLSHTFLINTYFPLHIFIIQSEHLLHWLHVYLQETKCGRNDKENKTAFSLTLSHIKQSNRLHHLMRIQVQLKISPSIWILDCFISTLCTRFSVFYLFLCCFCVIIHNIVIPFHSLFLMDRSRQSSEYLLHGKYEKIRKKNYWTNQMLYYYWM